MKERQGEMDPWSGQWAAFPIESSNEELNAVNQYLESVRKEARELAVRSVHKDSRKRPRVESGGLDYGEPNEGNKQLERKADRNDDSDARNRNELLVDLAEVQRVTFELIDSPISENGNVDLLTVFHDARRIYCALEPQHPSECTSLATWKIYASQNMPVPLGHTDLFRVYKYLSKWSFSSELHYIWAWAMLLRTPLVLTGDEISSLREMCRELRKRPNNWGRAIVTIVSSVFGQHDLSIE